MIADVVVRGGLWGWSFAECAIVLVVALAVIALVAIFVREAKVPIPPWVWQVIGVIILTVVIVLAIKFVASV